MNVTFTGLDWAVFVGYFVLLAGIGWYFSRNKADSSKDFFLGGNKMPMWVVAISVLATSQSAATFLGGPDQGYRGDFTYLATNLAAVLAAIFVAFFLLPRFYQYKVSTVYELLEVRFGESAKRQAGLMYLVGRVFASGARLYMAAIAVAMILFGNIDADSVIIAVLLMSIVGMAYSVMGGIKSVIYSDAIQCAVYILAAIFVIYFLLAAIPADMGSILAALDNPIDGSDSKLTLFNFDLDFGPGGAFTFWSIITGMVLLNIGAFGLDQDMTQRVLTCRDAKEGSKAMLWSVIMTIPVVALFITIGMLLYIVYQRPDVMMTEGAEVVQSFAGEKVTIFMYYILNEIPAGVRGLVTVGVIAAALSTLNSGLNSMSSVMVQDIYQPWKAKQNQPCTDAQLLSAGRIGMGLACLALASMAILCYYWQQHTDMPLLAFALSVMVFAYSGLLGVYFTAVFTKRGNRTTVLLALVAGFLITLGFQPYVLNTIAPDLQLNLGFSWQLCISTAVAFLICVSGKPEKSVAADAAQMEAEPA